MSDQKMTHIRRFYRMYGKSDKELNVEEITEWFDNLSRSDAAIARRWFRYWSGKGAPTEEVQMEHDRINRLTQIVAGVLLVIMVVASFYLSLAILR